MIPGWTPESPGGSANDRFFTGARSMNGYVYVYVVLRPEGHESQTLAKKDVANLCKNHRKITTPPNMAKQRHERRAERCAGGRADKTAKPSRNPANAGVETLQETSGNRS